MRPEGGRPYYNKDALSDVTITCDGQEFKAHRVIISAHSKCFAKALNGGWKERSERQIDIKDFDASVVEAMLRFMYSFDYSNIYGTSTMVFDAQMYQIADKYDIPALKAQSKNKFNVAVTTGWSMDDFPLAITVVYESTPPEDRGLRDLAVQTARKNINKLLGHDCFCELIRKTPDFAADLIPFLCVKPSESMQRYQCPSCANQFRGEFSADPVIMDQRGLGANTLEAALSSDLDAMRQKWSKTGGASTETMRSMNGIAARLESGLYLTVGGPHKRLNPLYCLDDKGSWVNDWLTQVQCMH
ncbi:hypothetical protein FPRO05_14270 [Fusarium proliferatum]|uniref:BTB domain-containing protein n=1 Tax=Gibberella intermedia TaxID=948311 RepID=A0A365MR62_GIBIN|nr:hypothetical protein FPRO05_14270 [Fusarium proliferatum]